MLDHLACTLTLSASACETKKALLETNLTVTVTRGAGRGSGALLRPCSSALAAGFVARNFDLFGGAEDSFFERQFQVVSEIGAALRATTTPAAPEDVSEAEDIAEDVAEIGEHVRIKTAKAGACTHARVAESVIVCPFLRVTQDRVRFGRFFKPLFSFFVSWIAVGVVLERQFAISAFDFLIARVARNAKDVVIVAFSVQMSLTLHRDSDHRRPKQAAI